MNHRLENPSELIPLAAREAYSILVGELLALRERWLNYDFLFGNSQARVDVLNRHAPYLFCLISDLIFENILITLCRLEEKVDGGRNLSLEYLLHAADIDLASEIGVKLSSSLASFRAQVGHLKKIRNKRIAHFDHKTIIGKISLARVTRDQLKEAIESAEQFVVQFDLHFTGSEIGFDCIRIEEGADLIMESLAKAEAFSALEKAGAVSYDSWKPFYR